MKIKLTESQFNHILKEMRFDSKSTGLFSEEEPVTELYKSTYKNAAADAVEQENDELAIKFLKHSNSKGIPDDIDADGIHDSEDDELSVDRFDIIQRIKSELNSLNEYYSDPYLTTEPQDKYQRLEKDLMGIVDKYSGDFGVDSYGVIDVIYQVLDQMFPRV
jgi:hypothetical protein